LHANCGRDPHGDPCPASGRARLVPPCGPTMPALSSISSISSIADRGDEIKGPPGYVWLIQCAGLIRMLRPRSGSKSSSSQIAMCCIILHTHSSESQVFHLMSVGVGVSKPFLMMTFSGVPTNRCQVNLWNIVSRLPLGVSVCVLLRR